MKALSLRCQLGSQLVPVGPTSCMWVHCTARERLGGGGQEGFCVATSILLTRVIHVHQTSSRLLSFVGLLLALWWCLRCLRRCLWIKIWCLKQDINQNICLKLIKQKLQEQTDNTHLWCCQVLGLWLWLLLSIMHCLRPFLRLCTVSLLTSSPNHTELFSRCW